MPLNEDHLKKVKKRGEELKAKSGNGGSGGPPIVYQPREGRLYMRFYHDPVGEILREIREHRNGKDGFKCPGSGCTICSVCDTMTGWRDLGFYKPQQKTLTYAVILDAQGLGERDRKYLRLNVPVLFVGKGMLGKLLSEYVADMADESEIEEFFSPDETGVTYVMELIIHRKHPWLEMKSRPVPMIQVPPLPYDFPPLSKCLYPENYAPDRAKVAKFIEDMTREYNSYLNIKETDSTPTSGLKFLDDNHVSEATPYEWTMKAPDSAPVAVKTETTVQQATPVISDDPEDFYEGEPREDCPTRFGRICEGHPACGQCDLWEPCQRMSVIPPK